MSPLGGNKKLISLLERHPAVGLLGPRQVGKTTLALEIARTRPSIYLDWEAPRDRAKLTEPELYFESHAGKLMISDEIQRMPEVFQVLRGMIDQRRRAGQKSAQFLVLASASVERLRQSSESLAGQNRFSAVDTAACRRDRWLRQGGDGEFMGARRIPGKLAG